MTSKTIKIPTSWRAEDWLEMLKEEVEPHFKNITFEKRDDFHYSWNKETNAYDIPVLVDYCIMIVVEDDFFEKQNFISTLKDGSTVTGHTRLKGDLENGIKKWVYENIGHRI